MTTVIRPTWAPDEQHQVLIDKTLAAVEAWKRAEAAMYDAFREARAGGVKLTYLFDQIDQTNEGDGPSEPSRATVYRHIGRAD